MVSFGTQFLLLEIVVIFFPYFGLDLSYFVKEDFSYPKFICIFSPIFLKLSFLLLALY